MSSQNQESSKERNHLWEDEGLPEADINISPFEITASPNDFNVATICSYLDRGAIVLPPYQRNYVWDKKRASKLIESLTLGLPVPQIFLYEDSPNKFSILDGQQRLLSIYFFTKNRFPKKEQRAFLREVFSAKGVFPQDVLDNGDYFETFRIRLPGSSEEDHSILHGKDYENLGDLQTQFDLRPVRCIIIKQVNPKDDNSAVYEIFDRLNTGGVNLKPQEIRSNLYYSDFYQALYEMNKDTRWRRLLRNRNPDSQLRDVELLLRGFAVLTYLENYKSSMTRFLNSFSHFAKTKMGKNETAYLKSIFDRFLDATSGLGESEFFRSGDRFSIGLYESVFYAIAHKAWERRSMDPLRAVGPEEIQALSELIAPTLASSTTSGENVRARLRTAEELLA